jgi:PST family polysaccharide transporter
MSVVSGIVAPSLQLFVRTKLLQDYNAHTAGLWQANTRLSDYYLNFVYTVLGIYYLPRLSSLKEKDEIKKEIRLGFMRILPPVILITVGIWIFREHIIRIFLTGSFIDMLVLLKWQLIGDIVKISSWILGYLMVAKAMKSYFIGTEIIFSISFVFFNFFFINHYGMVGTVYAFALNYFLYLVTLIVLLRKYII